MKGEMKNSEGWRPENLWRRGGSEEGQEDGQMGHWRGGPTEPRSKRAMEEQEPPKDYGVHWFGQRMSYEEAHRDDDRPMHRAAEMIKESVHNAVETAKEKAHELKARLAERRSGD